MLCNDIILPEADANGDGIKSAEVTSVYTVDESQAAHGSSNIGGTVVTEYEDGTSIEITRIE